MNSEQDKLRHAYHLALIGLFFFVLGLGAVTTCVFALITWEPVLLLLSLASLGTSTLVVNEVRNQIHRTLND